MTWPGREMALLKGNLPTVSRVCGVPYSATFLPVRQCQYGTVAESRLGSHTRVGLLPRSPCGPQPGAPRKTGRISDRGILNGQLHPAKQRAWLRNRAAPTSLGEGIRQAPLDLLVTSGAVRPGVAVGYHNQQVRIIWLIRPFLSTISPSPRGFPPVCPDHENQT